MTVDLTFDFVLELHFLVTGRFPTALMDEIGKEKNEIYERLSRDLARPDMLVGSRVFVVEGRRFCVLFASDLRQTDLFSLTRPLRAMHIDELQ